DVFPFSPGPYYATYLEGGVVWNCEFSHEEWDAPHQPTLTILTKKVFKDPSIGKTMVNQFPTPGEMVRIEALSSDQLTTKMSVLHCLMMSHGGELLARYRGLLQSYHEYVQSTDSRLKGYQEKFASLTGLKSQVPGLQRQIAGLNDKLSTFDAAFSKSKAKGKERKKKIKSLTKTLDQLNVDVVRLSTTLNQATILEAEKDEEILWLKASPPEFVSFFRGQFQGLVQKFLASDEFSRVQGELLSLAASVGFERGLRGFQSERVAQVIQNGNNLKRTGRDHDGRVIILPPMTVDEHIAVQRESKARTTLLQSIHDDHVADFHYMDDARDILRLQSKASVTKLKAKPDDKDINLKFLRGLPSSWSQVALTLKTKGRLELLSFDDLYYKLKTLEIDIKGYSTHSSSQSPSHSAFVSTTNVLHSLVAESEPEQQVAYEDFEQIDKLDLEEMDIKWKMAMLSVRVNKFEKKAGRKIEFDKKEAARFNKKAVRCYKCLQKGHFARNAGFAPKEYGMVAGCGAACEEGVAEVYSLITGNGTDAAAGEFALMGMTSEIRVLSIELENTTNLLKHSERINVEAEIAKKDLQTKLDNHLAKTEKWTSSSKNLFRLIDSSMSVRTKVGLGFDKYIRESELGWDDSEFSIFTPNSEEVEGRPLFHKFTKADGMKVVPLPLFGNYIPLSDTTDLDETQMTYVKKSSDSIGYIYLSNDLFSCDNSGKSSEIDILLRSGKVSIPAARPKQVLLARPTPVSTGRPKPISTSKQNRPPPVHAGRRNSSSVTSGWWQSTARPMAHLPTPTSSYFQTSTPFGPHVYYNQMHWSGMDGQNCWLTALKGSISITNAGDEGIVDSGCSRSMTGNKERFDDFQPFKGGKITFGKADEGYLVGYSASYIVIKANQSAGTQDVSSNPAGFQDDDSDSDIDTAEDIFQQELARLKDHMKERLRNCHGHNLSKGNIIKIFYHGLNEITQEVLNAAAGVIFLYNTPNQAYQLLEDKYKELQSSAKQPTPNLDDDDIPMSREKEAKFMQTFRKTRFYNDYRNRDSNHDNWRSSGRNDYNRDNYRSNTDDKPYDL
ncbi:hypothetical protein Tco_0132725, partial [Tanacetum coccineum]